jgi:hypothetical protein
MSVANPRDADIVEWLVRCAEDPVTRWEGTYDLAMSHYMLDQQASQEPSADAPSLAPDESAKPIDGDDSAETASVTTREFDAEYSADVTHAKLLTTEQKYRLTTALVANTRLADTDYHLLDLAQRWDDPRLVPYLLTQLDLVSKPSNTEPTSTYFIQNIMKIVAEKLGDDALKAFTEKFGGEGYDQFDSYEEEDQSGDGEQEVAESKTGEVSAEVAAGIKKRNAEVQYFVTLALSTSQKTATIQADDSFSRTLIPLTTVLTSRSEAFAINGARLVLFVSHHRQADYSLQSCHDKLSQRSRTEVTETQS